ncbi:hypothetical protein [Micromonospora sp. RL09-050-HVF-A]|uniref:hypothetical protein n=1 Tax=unclassified Micromonospora TaxID=2617518 RepID=UPI001C5F668D|nr:hypothetical protein [Micromonospora sp. RL09-050-HVF-A]MBW4701700.1 hypothetical protein [Micromonospora sp. RL09-050-HVF-A]
MDPQPSTGLRQAVRTGALVLAGLLTATGCSGTAEPVAARSAGASPPPPDPAVPRLDKPTTVLGTWNESLDRRLTMVAQSTMSGLKPLLDGEPGSAVGTAYIPVKEEHSAELGLYRPGDRRVVLLSGVSGTVPDPERALDQIFARLTAITDVTPVPPGPVGGSARCGHGRSGGVWFDVCAWADRHTLGVVHLADFPQTAQPQEIFRQIRAQTEHAAP